MIVSFLCSKSLASVVTFCTHIILTIFWFCLVASLCLGEVLTFQRRYCRWNVKQRYNVVVFKAMHAFELRLKIWSPKLHIHDLFNFFFNISKSRMENKFENNLTFSFSKVKQVVYSLYIGELMVFVKSKDLFVITQLSALWSIIIISAYLIIERINIQFQSVMNLISIDLISFF